jgi:protocatechuate 3,4-dioxygenase beta subunit
MKFRGQGIMILTLTKISGQNGIATEKLLIVQGKIHDTDCNPVEGAIVENMQANHFVKISSRI